MTGVTITLRDVYDRVCIVEGVVTGMRPYAETLLDHERRIRAVERWRYALPGALLASAGGIISTLIATR